MDLRCRHGVLTLVEIARSNDAILDNANLNLRFHWLDNNNL